MRMKGSVIRKITIIIIFVLGLIVFMYPVIARKINSDLTNKTIEQYDKNVKESSEDAEKSKELADLYNQMQTYNQKIYNEGQKGILDPFAYEVPGFDLEKFGMKDQIAGYLTIPRMNIKLPIYLGASNENMAKGAAQLTQTSMPIGGINTNTVIAAHRGMRTQAMFRDIELIQLGDEFTITNYWGVMTYKVIDIKVISPSDVSKILIQPGKDLVTLITCHPYTKNSQRYAVYAQRMPDNPSDASSVQPVATSTPATDDSNLIKFEDTARTVAIIVLFIGLLIFVIRLFGRKIIR